LLFKSIPSDIINYYIRIKEFAHPDFILFIWEFVNPFTCGAALGLARYSTKPENLVPTIHAGEFDWFALMGHSFNLS
jgi:hypothetical protein